MIETCYDVRMVGNGVKVFLKKSVGWVCLWGGIVVNLYDSLFKNTPNGIKNQRINNRSRKLRSYESLLWSGAWLDNSC